MRIEPHMPAAEYHAQPELSASQIKAINTNPHRWHHDRATGKKSTPAMNLGSATHAIILGEEEDVVRLDVADYKTKAAQKLRDDAIADGKYPLKVGEWQQAQDMADAARRNPYVAELLATGQPEVSFFTTHPETGQPMRGRTDLVDTTAHRITDFKTTDSADPALFGKQAARMGYQVPAAHYGDSWGRHADTSPWEVLFVLIEREPPYTVSVCKLGSASLDLGRKAIARGIHTYRQATMTDSWATPWPGITTTELPVYEFYAEDAR